MLGEGTTEPRFSERAREGECKREWLIERDSGAVQPERDMREGDRKSNAGESSSERRLISRDREGRSPRGGEGAVGRHCFRDPEVSG